MGNGTASGMPNGPGMVAMNGEPFGSRWQVLSGSFAGSVLTVNDRIGSGSEFDIWVCPASAANAYGRQEIRVRRVA